MPESAHTATVTPEPGGFLVSCPHGCNLGTSAHQPDQAGAGRRVELHALSTAPLDVVRVTAIPAGKCCRYCDPCCCKGRNPACGTRGGNRG